MPEVTDPGTIEDRGVVAYEHVVADPQANELQLHGRQARNFQC